MLQFPTDYVLLVDRKSGHIAGRGTAIREKCHDLKVMLTNSWCWCDVIWHRERSFAGVEGKYSDSLFAGFDMLMIEHIGHLIIIFIFD